ncbi:MAG: hypothetical protein ABI690_16070 [Chloroflexota bacterium]
MNNNANWDREAELKRLFDPDNLNEWVNYSPERFIALMINEIRRENDLIGAWSKLLNDNPEFRGLTFDVNGQKIDALFFTETILRATRITARLLDTAGAYRELVNKKDSDS